MQVIIPPLSADLAKHSKPSLGVRRALAIFGLAIFGFEHGNKGCKAAFPGATSLVGCHPVWR
jgi:hypothetical protein